jgi:2',3'-cyclic-nucleotide 2'-phosphodiesterase (5'-nucleotidase family)
VRFVHHAGRTLYFHSGSWLSYVSVVALQEEGGRLDWTVEQEPLPTDAKTNPAFATLVRDTIEKTLTPEDRAIVGHASRALTPPEAARFAVEAARSALQGDAAVIGGTSFGGGLPAGEVSRYVFDGCVRFNGTLFSAEVSGAELQQLLAIANQGPDTPWEARSNENLIAVGPATLDPPHRYRLVTTDWIARNAKQYLGPTAPAFTEAPTVHLKEAVIAALQRTP